MGNGLKFQNDKLREGERKKFESSFPQLFEVFEDQIDLNLPTLPQIHHGKMAMATKNKLTVALGVVYKFLEFWAAIYHCGRQFQKY